METKEKAPKKEAPTLLSIFEQHEEAINNIEALKDEHPDDFERNLSTLSDRFNELLNQNQFFASIYIGVMDFHKKAKRRSTRKPLTIERMKSLNDDLKTLSKILKI